MVPTFRSLTAVSVVVAVAGAPLTALGQSDLFAVNFGGGLYRVDPSTAGVTLVGATGFTRLNTAATSPGGQIYTSRSRLATNPADTNQLIRVDPVTAVGTLIADYGTANDFRALAFTPSGALYAIRDNGSNDELFSIDPVTGAATLIGGTGRSDIQGMTSTGTGEIFAVGVNSGGQLYRVDPATGATTVVLGGLGTTSGMNALEWNTGNEAWSCQNNLYRIDLLTGAASLIGNMGQDMRGLAVVRTGPPPCYANCDGSTQPPVLNVQDFSCFLTRYAAGESYANCDDSTQPPVLNVQDFSCFLTKYAAGCP